MRTVLHVVGARPNFMKVAPIHRAISQRGMLKQLLVHTGQHYDEQMSAVFFRDLGLPEPDIHLEVGAGSHAAQTAKVMVALESLLSEHRVDLVSVVGDVNSTLGAALVAAKMGVRLAHVEAGLRSGDRRMPEEINRLVTDRISDELLTPSRDADDNLKHEGIDERRIHFVGNVMIDSLLLAKERADRLDTLERLGVQAKAYAVCTLHRPSNVDDLVTLKLLMAALAHLSEQLPVLFPVHPRTRRRLEEVGDGPQHRRPAAADVFPASTSLSSNGLRLLEPLGYLEFLRLTSQARLILTDSGGLQEEATALGIPCLTLRENTERPVTVSQGTNVLVGTDPQRIWEEATRALRFSGRARPLPELWDGRAGERIAALYERWLSA